MDLKQTDYFRSIAELGSFTRASCVLRVAQPAPSWPPSGRCARRAKLGRKFIGKRGWLAEVAMREVVIPNRPQAIRMRRVTARAFA